MTLLYRKRTAYCHASGRPKAVDTWAPLCMLAEDWADWRALNSRIRAKRARRPCEDCPLGFAAEMRAEGKCNGTPAGVADDGDEETTMDEQAAARAAAFTGRAVERVRLDDRQTRVEVAITAPCEHCGHRTVCGLRAGIEALAETAVRLPRLDDAFSVRLAATLECAHFQRVPKRGVPHTEETRAKQSAARLAVVARKREGGAIDHSA